MPDHRYEFLRPATAALVLIDHHAGLIAGVRSQDPNALRRNTASLTRLAGIFDLPVVVTGEPPGNIYGPVVDEVKQNLTGIEILHRTSISAFDDQGVVDAVAATGRRQLVMAGVTTDVCLSFAAIQAVAAGYDVYAVLDASGSFDVASEAAAVQRMSAAGVKPTTWVGVAAELQHDWALPTGRQVGWLYGSAVPAVTGVVTNLQSATV